MTFPDHGGADRSLESFLTGQFRWFHSHPELSGQEVATTARIRTVLEDLAIEVLDVGLPTGLIARIRGRAGSEATRPVVALRADIDALPITERSGSANASVHPGVQHACGHDFHLVALLGAAALLSRRAASLPGDVVLVFQPAEESMAGARQVIATGALQSLKVRAMFGLHVNADLARGHVAVAEGALSAAVDRFRVDVRGRGGHAAAPHLGEDVPLAISHSVAQLQSVVSRRVDPLEPAVVSVTHIDAGHTWNVLPDSGWFEGTARTFSDRTRREVESALRSILAGVAAASNVEIEVRWQPGPPAVVNDGELAMLVREACQDLSIPVETPRLRAGGEDFAEYRALMPGAFYLIGMGAPEAPTHSDRFVAKEGALLNAARVHYGVARRALRHWSREIPPVDASRRL